MQNKSVLISIQPKWCELILRGEKTIEVRKTKPKLELPFKCYIYQSKGRDRLIEVMKDGNLNYGEIYHGKTVFIKTRENSGYKGLFGREQKVIGEFVCDDIFEIVKVGYTMRETLQYRAVKDCTVLSDEIFDHSCLTKNEIEKYLDGRKGYAWHISKLVIYDKPKELGEFEGLRKTKFGYEPIEIKRPPQSWCYVEECKDNA